jgi:hypothetical protein
MSIYNYGPHLPSKRRTKIYSNKKNSAKYSIYCFLILRNEFYFIIASLKGKF